MLSLTIAATVMLSGQTWIQARGVSNAATLESAATALYANQMKKWGVTNYQNDRQGYNHKNEDPGIHQLLIVAFKY